MALFSRLTLALLSTVEILQTTDIREKEAALKKDVKFDLGGNVTV